MQIVQRDTKQRGAGSGLVILLIVIILLISAILFYANQQPDVIVPPEVEEGVHDDSVNGSGSERLAPGSTLTDDVVGSSDTGDLEEADSGSEDPDL